MFKKTPQGEATSALLLIADISGFTAFMRLHAVSTSHARETIARLLRTLIAAAGPPLQVAEVEGDAVFFYALADGQDVQALAAQVKRQMLLLFQAFGREVEVLSRIKTCVCDACATVGQLRLKQVVHVGEVGIEKIDRFEKLFGLDVIVVHRMLKNSVPSQQYLMMTTPAYAACTDFFSLAPEWRTEQFEGLGAVDTVVFYDAALAALAEVEVAQAPPARLALLGWKLKMQLRTLLELAGLRPAPTAPTA